MPQSIKDILSAPIPLSVVIFLIVQTMGFVWWTSAQVNTFNLHLAASDMKIAQIEKTVASSASHEGRIIVLEQVAGRIRDDLQEIKIILRGEKQGYLSNDYLIAPASTPQQGSAN